MGLPLGSKAPDFELPCQTGELVRLSDVTAEGAVVLFFYPRDDSAGCTVESCAFRDRYEVFKDAGADILGVSADTIDSHRQFASKYTLGFRILSDPDKRVAKQYKVKPTIPLLLPGRATYVIDRQRVIRHHFSSQVNAKGHVTEALRIVEQLTAQA